MYKSDKPTYSTRVFVSKHYIYRNVQYAYTIPRQTDKRNAICTQYQRLSQSVLTICENSQSWNLQAFVIVARLATSNHPSIPRPGDCGARTRSRVCSSPYPLAFFSGHLTERNSGGVFSPASGSRRELGDPVEVFHCLMGSCE